jgi:5-methylcytosine-specific restriction enzyme A
MSYKDRLKETFVCKLCGRNIPEKRYIEEHHLIPASKGGKKKEVFCIDCGDQVHKLFTNNELRDKYNTVEKLKNDPSIYKWINWVRKRKAFGICMKKKKRKR